MEQGSSSLNPINIGSCPHPVTAYNRGNFRARYSYDINIIQLLLGGGRTQPEQVVPRPTNLQTSFLRFGENRFRVRVKQIIAMPVRSPLVSRGSLPVSDKSSSFHAWVVSPPQCFFPSQTILIHRETPKFSLL